MFASDASPRLTVRFPPSARARLASVAMEQGLTMNAVVVVALQAYLAQQAPLLVVGGRKKRRIVDQPPHGYPRTQFSRRTATRRALKLS